MGEVKCVRGHLVQALNSAAGWYVGTIDEDGFPYCRISQNYYKTCKDAEDVIKNGTYIQRTCMENQFCNGGMGCFNSVDDIPSIVSISSSIRDMDTCPISAMACYPISVKISLMRSHSLTLNKSRPCVTHIWPVLGCVRVIVLTGHAMSHSNKFNPDTPDEIRRTIYAK